MLKQIAILEVKRAEKSFSLHLPEGTNLGELHDVLHEMLGDIIGRIQEAQKVVAPAEKTEIKEVEAIPEPDPA